MLIKVKNKDTLIFGDFSFRCALGKKGTSSKKKEGDFCTPKGSFGLKTVYYRSDRIKNIKTKLDLKKINYNMGWCNDPTSKKYNSLIKSFIRSLFNSFIHSLVHSFIHSLDHLLIQSLIHSFIHVFMDSITR